MRFLIVDDDAQYRKVLRYHLEVEWPDALITEYQPSSAGPLTEAFALHGLDLVLLGHPVEREQDLYWLGMLRRRADCPPVIVFAQGGDELLAVDALQAGAASYFPKDKVTHQRLVEAIKQGVRPSSGSSTPTAPWPQAGVLPGLRRHRFVEQLHASDLSAVYLAESVDTGERCVFKVLRHVPDMGGGALFDRFLQEYEVIAGVAHTNVVRIFDLGIADDQAFIAMEYLSAGSLARRLSAPLPWSQAIEYTRQMASALSAIHEAGILHRDLKPANVMFREDETLALIDFGLAKQLWLDVALTGTGQIFGTPYYMSPEQGHAQAVDARSDIYSLGCMLYEMLTGERPFLASSPMAVIYKHAQAPRPRLEGSLARWQPLLDRMLAVDPARRYQSAEALRETLDDIAPRSTDNLRALATPPASRA
jgi:ActR/RegA family two-component response regulator